MDFFDDIIVPPSHLFQNTKLSTPTKEDPKPVWIWRLETDDPEEPVREYFFDANTTVRWRVEEEVWHDQAPAGPRLEGQTQSQGSGSAKAGATGGSKVVIKTEEPEHGGARTEEEGERQVREAIAKMNVDDREQLKEENSPWRLIGSMSQPGLGCTEWW